MFHARISRIPYNRNCYQQYNIYIKIEKLKTRVDQRVLVTEVSSITVLESQQRVQDILIFKLDLVESQV